MEGIEPVTELWLVDQGLEEGAPVAEDSGEVTHATLGRGGHTSPDWLYFLRLLSVKIDLDIQNSIETYQESTTTEIIARSKPDSFLVLDPVLDRQS